ncbi:flippase-like domain-containing protein [bacterium]|nr:flippase-like domain-containing protein [bacterium]
MSGARRNTLLRALVSLVLVAVLLRRIPLETVRASLAHPDPLSLAAALGVFAVSALGGALQWAWLLRGAGLRTPVGEMLRLSWVGLFFNNFLLGNVGGDAVKVMDLGRREGRTGAVLGATALDRLLGLLALTVLALGTLVLARSQNATLPPTLPLVLALAAWLGALMLLFSGRAARLFTGLLRRLPWPGPAVVAETFLAEMRGHRGRPATLARVFLLALAVQFLRVATHLLCAWALGVEMEGVRILQLFVLVPLLGILISLPISLNGLGLREMAAAGLFVSVGLTATEADAVAVEFLAYLVQVAVSLAGGVLFLAGRRGSGNRA